MILTNEQFAECLKLLTLTDQDFAESIADLQKRLEESRRHSHSRVCSIKERARNFAQRCDPFEPESETTTGTCAVWRESVAKIFEAHIVAACAREKKLRDGLLSVLPYDPARDSPVQAEARKLAEPPAGAQEGK